MIRQKSTTRIQKRTPHLRIIFMMRLARSQRGYVLVAALLLADLLLLTFCSVYRLNFYRPSHDRTAI